MGSTGQTRRLAILLAAGLGLVTIPVSAASAETAVCGSLSAPTWHVVNPALTSNLLTPWQSEVASAAAYGFTDVRGTPFSTSLQPATGLTAIHRLYHPGSHDFEWVALGSQRLDAAEASGYVDQGLDFYASTAAVAECTQPVLEFTKGSFHRYGLAVDEASLVAGGWVNAGTAFHAKVAPASPPGDTTFTFAVMPDTQNEVGDTDLRMSKRVSWLMANRAAIDLRWVLHNGDLHNWDTDDHYQYENMSTRLAPLTVAGIPFIATPGNHDTAAVCPGGSACPGENTSITVRDTTTWNTYYPPSRFGLQGVYEAGKSDNGWRTFSAGGVDWLVLNLEIWPRSGVISWVKSVIATHPDHNVIVLTHPFLAADGTVSTSNGGYGANSPAVLWQALDDYPNVVMTFSGHVGEVANTSLTAADGHKVATFLQHFHAQYTNPVQLVTIDTAAGTIKTETRSNFDRSKPIGAQDVTQIYPYSATITGMRWVR